jgi:hypothetical protein
VITDSTGGAKEADAVAPGFSI